MKKKASFLISGITTVALLATAVGSFAAWNKLTADEQSFTATTDTRAEISVTTLNGVKEDKKLLPASIDGKVDGVDVLYEDGKYASEAIVGGFKVEQIDSSNKINVKAAVEIANNDSSNNTELGTYFETKVYKWESNAKGDQVTDLANLANGEYVVTLGYKDTVNNTIESAIAEKLANQTINVKVQCTAVKTPSVPA